MRTKVEKLYLNKYVSVRDYIVKEALQKGENLIIYFNDGYMVVKHKDLSKGRTDPQQNFSKFDKKPYHLVDFLWKPQEDLTVEGQQRLI